MEKIKNIDEKIKKESLYDTGAKRAKPIECFNGDMVREYLTRAVMRVGTVTFEFVNGCTITKPYTNGRGGNKKGWSVRRGESAANIEIINQEEANE